MANEQLSIKEAMDAWNGFPLVEVPTIDFEINHVQISEMLDLSVGDALEIVKVFSEEVYDEIMDRLPDIIATVIDKCKDEREEQVRLIRQSFKLVKE